MSVHGLYHAHILSSYFEGSYIRSAVYFCCVWFFSFLNDELCDRLLKQ